MRGLLGPWPLVRDDFRPARDLVVLTFLGPKVPSAIAANERVYVCAAMAGWESYGDAARERGEAYQYAKALPRIAQGVL